jgi:hypothetical protein
MARFLLWRRVRDWVAMQRPVSARRRGVRIPDGPRPTPRSMPGPWDGPGGYEPQMRQALRDYETQQRRARQDYETKA